METLGTPGQTVNNLGLSRAALTIESPTSRTLSEARTLLEGIWHKLLCLLPDLRLPRRRRHRRGWNILSCHLNRDPEPEAEPRALITGDNHTWIR